MNGLDRLWAPWRMSYIESVTSTDPVGEGPPDGSVFTRILTSGLSDDETHIVWRGEQCFAILNAYPYTSGHALVMPYREVADLEALTTTERSELWSAVTACVEALKVAYQPEGINIGMNLGRAAGAGVPTHLHVHVLPRWNGDTNVLTTVAELRVMPESLSTSADRLRAAWPR